MFKLYDYIIEKTNRNNYFQLETIDLLNQFIEDDRFELYIPHINELCYFFNVDDIYPTLGKYKGIENDKPRADVGTSYTEYINCIGECTLINYTWDFCAPFGELPVQFKKLLGE